MSTRDRLNKILRQRGMTATLNYNTGTDCPCRLTFDASNPTYSPQWHADNPSIEDCNSTLLISRVSHSVNIRLLAVDIRAAYNSKALTQIIQDSIGELKRVDLAALGTVNYTTGEFVNMNTYLNNESAYITLNNLKYNIVVVIDEFIDVAVGQLIILKRYE